MQELFLIKPRTRSLTAEEKGVSAVVGALQFLFAHRKEERCLQPVSGGVRASPSGSGSSTTGSGGAR